MDTIILSLLGLPPALSFVIYHRPLPPELVIGRINLTQTPLV
jgi:hypothetical protein